MEKWKSMDTVAAHGKRDYMTEFVPQKDELFDTLDRTLVQEIYPVNELE